jgi:hypothetical protein
MGCIAKLGCMILVAGVVAVIVAIWFYTQWIPWLP